MLWRCVPKYIRLDARDELDLPGCNLVLEESVDVERAPCIHPIDDAQRIERHFMTMEKLCGGNDFVECGFAVLGDTILIVKFFWAVNAEANQESVLLEKGRPLLIEQSAIGLKIVLDALIGFLVSLLKRHDLLEKLDAEQGGFSALPSKNHFIAILALNVLSDVCFENLVGDPELGGTREQFLLVQVIAIPAVKIADCANGFHDGVVGALCTRLRLIWRKIANLE